MNSAKEKIEIELSKPKIAVIALGSLFFVAIGLLIWIANDQISYRVFSIITLLFFGVCGIYGIGKLFDRSPGLVISDEGIMDNSSAVSAGFIKWDDIIRIDHGPVSGVQFLYIHVRNPKEYLERINPIKRVIMKINQKLCGTPLTVSAGFLKCDFRELVAIIETKEKETLSSIV